MTTTLLENEKVLEFFGCGPSTGCCGGLAGGLPVQHMALRVLASMSEPIKKGERMLFVPGNNNPISMEIASEDIPSDVLRCWLRLPSAHQPHRPPSGCEHAGSLHDYKPGCIFYKQDLNAQQWQNRAALAENLICKIEKEVSERDYGEWGKNLRNLLSDHRHMTEGEGA